jgi:hypothetical protein
VRSIERAALPALVLLALAIVPAAYAQERYTFTLGALGGLGGSLDADPGDDLGNRGFQLNFGLITDPKTHLMARLGRLDLDTNEGFGRLQGAELDYLTVAGEYRYAQTFYESGVYFGLGGYRLTGDLFGQPGAEEEDTSFGVVLGLTGEFELSRRLGVLVEISGHWADLEEAQTFALAHVGLAFHF